MNKLLEVGQKAPNFKLRKSNGSLNNDPQNFVQLSDYTGKKNVVLSFYPADFSDVCSSQLALYNELIPTWEELNAEVIGISVDGSFCHKAFQKYNNIKLPLLSDFEPKGDYAKKCGVYNEDLGVTERAILVIDQEGTVQYSYVSPMGENPGAKEIIETLKKI